MSLLLLDFSTKNPLAALLEGARLVEMLPLDGSSRVGEVRAGVIKTVLRGQALFIDIGLEKNAYLDLSDPRERRLVQNPSGLMPGKPLTVQVLKDPHGDKGAAVTSELSFSGARLVLVGAPGGAAVSRRVEDPAERARLKEIGGRLLPPGFGLIMRTGCAGAPEAAIAAELHALASLAARVRERAVYSAPPCAVWSEAPEARVLKDLAAEGIEKVIVSGRDSLTGLTELAESLGLAGLAFEPYPGSIPIFDAYGVNKQAAEALQTKVWLDCGGYITVEQTQACAVIDVNAGKYVSAKDRERAAAKVNAQAAAEAARQLRLRNLSGIIIIDFINQQSAEATAALCEALRRELARDRASAVMVGMTALSLMQITRKKTGPALAEFFH